MLIDLKNWNRPVGSTRNGIDSSVHDRRSLCKNLHISTKIVRSHHTMGKEGQVSNFYSSALFVYFKRPRGQQMAIKASLRPPSFRIKLQSNAVWHTWYMARIRRNYSGSNLHPTRFINKTFFIPNGRLSSFSLLSFF